MIYECKTKNAKENIALRKTKSVPEIWKVQSKRETLREGSKISNLKILCRRCI